MLPWQLRHVNPNPVPQFQAPGNKEREEIEDTPRRYRTAAPDLVCVRNANGTIPVPRHPTMTARSVRLRVETNPNPDNAGLSHQLLASTV